MKKISIGLLPKIIFAILAGIGCGFIFPDALIRVFTTFNGVFGNYLNFVIPLIIVGLVAPGIAELGNRAGKLLLITALLAYGFTIATGFMSYLSADALYPSMLASVKATSVSISEDVQFTPYFVVEMPAVMGVMTALVLAFTIGLGVASIHGQSLRHILDDFKEVVYRVITYAIIPFLPIYIFGIFLDISGSGRIVPIIELFSKVILLIFILTVILLIVQFTIAGLVSKKNPIRLLRNMFPAYMTALGTQSSAATIPITLRQTLKNGVDEELAGFVVPLCATIHLSGSTMKIVACAIAIMMLNNTPVDFATMSGFIMMLGITMVAAPGVPGGAIMASLGLLGSMLGFDAEAQGLMVALYIAMDSFGTATNVTGDGAIAVIVDRIYRKGPTVEKPSLVD